MKARGLIWLVGSLALATAAVGIGFGWPEPMQVEVDPSFLDADELYGPGVFELGAETGPSVPAFPWALADDEHWMRSHELLERSEGRPPVGLPTRALAIPAEQVVVTPWRPTFDAAVQRMLPAQPAGAPLEVDARCIDLGEGAVALEIELPSHWTTQSELVLAFEGAPLELRGVSMHLGTDSLISGWGVPSGLMPGASGQGGVPDGLWLVVLEDEAGLTFELAYAGTSDVWRGKHGAVGRVRGRVERPFEAAQGAAPASALQELPPWMRAFHHGWGCF